MKIFKILLTVFVITSSHIVHAECPEFVDASQLDKAKEIEFAKAGLINNPSDFSVYAYIDEAMAERKGAWSCHDKTFLFDLAAKRKGLPDGKILYSIAMNESKRNGNPYPWTINAFGRGYFFNTREEAYSAAQWLVNHKYTLFDIGIMQVNWKYHHKRFDSLWDAFQPTTNINAASDILLENYTTTNDWAKSVKWYHNRGAARGKMYFKKFIKHFEEISKEKTI